MTSDISTQRPSPATPLGTSYNPSRQVEEQALTGLPNLLIQVREQTQQGPLQPSAPLVAAFVEQLHKAGIFVPKEWNSMIRKRLALLQQTKLGQDTWQLLQDADWRQAFVDNDEQACARWQQQQQALFAYLSSPEWLAHQQGSVQQLGQHETASMQMMIYVMYVLQHNQQTLLQGIQDLFAATDVTRTNLQAISKYSQDLQEAAGKLAEKMSKQVNEELRSKVMQEVVIKEFPHLHSISPTGAVYWKKVNKKEELTRIELDVEIKKATSLEQQLHKNMERANQQVGHMYTQSEQNMAMINSLITSFLRSASRLTENLK